MLTIKFISQQRPHIWSSYFPTPEHRLGSLQFTFDRHATRYDWLVVYGEVPPKTPGQKTTALETLSCHPDNTILITTEPESIKLYEPHFTRQFGTVLTSQPAWALKHPNAQQRALMNHWFYGNTDESNRPYADLMQGPNPAQKAPKVSMVFSPKAMRHTQHAKRFEFMTRLMQLMPELDCYGRGAKPLNDKAEALDGYQYHIAIENHFSEHHITEKLSDSLLARCLTFYAGAPNTADYVPAGSFIPLNLNQPEATAQAIRAAIAENLYETRLAAIEQARHLIVQEHNLFAAIAQVVQNAPQRTSQGQSVLLGRHALRQQYPWRIPKIIFDKALLRLRASLQQKRHRF